MKIFIHTDLEGAVNVDNMEMTHAGKGDTDYAYENLVKDVNAAVEGACVAGATEITVLDSHGGGNGFNPTQLDSRAKYDFNGLLLAVRKECTALKYAPADFDVNSPKKWWGSLDESYAATFFIGAHPMAGTLDGFLDHTFSSQQWYNYYINDKKHGEMGMWATVCSHYKVPFIMMSGDEAACEEARSFFPDVETAAVKKGVGRNTCVMYDPEESRKKIRDAAYNAVMKLKQGIYKPYKVDFPANVKLELYRSDFCDAIAKKEGITRLDARTVTKTVQTGLDILI